MNFLDIFNIVVRAVKPMHMEMTFATAMDQVLDDIGIDSLDGLMMMVYIGDIYGIDDEVGQGFTKAMEGAFHYGKIKPFEVKIVKSHGTGTLTANVASTSLQDSRIGVTSFIQFMPTTANAASEIGAGTLYVSARAEGVATLNHANNAQADRAYTYLVIA